MGSIRTEPEVGTISPPNRTRSPHSGQTSCRPGRAGRLGVRCDRRRTPPRHRPHVPHHPRGPGPARESHHRGRHGTRLAIRPGPAVFEQLAGHEQVVFCHDEPTGLRAIIAIHSTALGPGPRRHPVLPLRRRAGGARRRPRALPRDDLQGRGRRARPRRRQGRDHRRPRRRSRPRRCSAPTAGSSRASTAATCTACDVGTFSEDMDVVARECRYVTGRTVAHGGAGDSSVLTAYGVFQGMRAAAAGHLGRPTLAGRPDGRRRRRRQGRPAPRRPPRRGRRRGGRHRREPGRGRRRRAPPPGGPRPSAAPRQLVARAARRLRPLRARRRHRRPGRRRPRCSAPRRWSAARRTTSSPTPASTRCWPTPGCSTRPTTSSTPAA